MVKERIYLQFCLFLGDMEKRMSCAYVFIKRNLLLVLYPFFLFVQCLFAVQYSHYAPAEVAQVVNPLHCEKSKGKIAVGNKPANSPKHTTHLNKRFQPGNVPMIPGGGDELCIHFVDRDKIITGDEHLFISFKLPFSFRGPPSVV